ncbi:possible membrane protein [Candidatus Pelagibacter ubique HTCC1062]|uniref:Possible membrane protein n=2 Tax=Pelagibacter ubique TaxID=198252 RepID=Q4FMQ0_PELUB|nr:possible membrane protein [Candidatus Pelagibacter ubique HTCC1062]
MIATSGDRKKIKNVSIKEIKGMIDSFTISDEKFINNEYFANLETTFNKKKILKFLENKNIFPSIPQRNKVLLFPILIETKNNNIYLFNNNIFYDKWNEQKNSYDLLDYLLPSEDIEDLIELQKISKDIETYDFSNLINKYDIKDNIILIIYKESNRIRTLSKINLNNSLKIQNKNYPKLDVLNNNDFSNIVENLKQLYEDQWKKNNEINTSIKLPLTISINSKKTKKIIELEQVLYSLDLVSDFSILNFNSEIIQYKITYNGTPNIFLNDMKEKNLELEIKNNMWILK